MPSSRIFMRSPEQMLCYASLTNPDPMTGLQLRLLSLTGCPLYSAISQVLDYTVAGSSSTKHDARSSDVLSSNNLRTADLSCNSIQEIRDLSAFRRLVKLVLHGNLIQHIGRGLQQLHMLQHLNLSANKISTCRGLEGA